MRFGIASNTKLFVAAMLLKLEENNILSLEDSLHTYISITNPNINPNIKIHQLLNHTSGVSDPFFTSPWFDTINNNSTRIFTPDEVLGWVGPPLFTPGTSWGYSNTNYVLAAMVAKSATGVELAQMFRDSIISPLNLSETFTDVQESVSGILAHRWWNSIDYHDTSRVGLNTAVGYAGSIFSTSADMAYWYNALFNGDVINQTSLNKLTTFVTTSNPNYQYGLGLSRETTQGFQYWGHGGRTWGYKSKMIYDNCLDVVVTGLCNSDPAGSDAVTFLLYRAVKNHIPACSGPISGPASVCEGTNSVTYTVPPVPNANSYVWTFPSGVSGTSTSNTISLNFGANASSGIIKVTGVNNYGPGGSSSLSVTVHPKPATSPITGPTNVCTGSKGVTYSVNNTVGSSYVWVITGGNQASGNNSNAITVDWGQAGPGQIIVVETNVNNCTGTPVLMAVNINDQATYYQDADGDGFGNPNQHQVACGQPTGYVANNLDCNDSNALINPVATEICNNVDDNCNGNVDETYSLLVNSNQDSGINTLRQILQCAQNNDTIRFAATIDTIKLLSPVTINKNITLLDETAGNIVLAFNLDSSGFNGALSGISIPVFSAVKMENINIFHQNNSPAKPAVTNHGNLTLKNCTFKGIPVTVFIQMPGSHLVHEGIIILK